MTSFEAVCLNSFCLPCLDRVRSLYPLHTLFLAQRTCFFPPGRPQSLQHIITIAIMTRVLPRGLPAILVRISRHSPLLPRHLPSGVCQRKGCWKGANDMSKQFDGANDRATKGNNHKCCKCHPKHHEESRSVRSTVHMTRRHMSPNFLLNVVCPT